MLGSAGYSSLHACFVQPVIFMSEARGFLLMGAREVAPFAVRCGMASESETNQVLRELESAEFDQGSYYTFPRQAQVFGHKL
jgi:hypothetical protein